jgi:TonB family protein
MSDDLDSEKFGFGCGCGAILMLCFVCASMLQQCKDNREAVKKNAAIHEENKKIERERKKMEEEKQDYLLRYNPQLKNLRDKLAEESRACQNVINSLESMMLGFQREASKKMVQEKVNELKKIRDQLVAHFDHADEEAEKGVALLKFNQIDGGGLAAQDISQLLRDSQPILKLSQSARRAVASAMGQASNPAVNQHDYAESLPMNDQSAAGATGSSTGHAVAPTTFYGIPLPSAGATGPSTGSAVATDSNSNPSDNTANQQVDSAQAKKALPKDSQSADPGASFDDKVAMAVPVYKTFRVGKLPDGFLNVRSSPSLKSRVLAKIMRSANGIIQTGEIIHDGKDNIDWMPISYAGVRGFVSAGFLIPNEDLSSAPTDERWRKTLSAENESAVRRGDRDRQNSDNRTSDRNGFFVPAPPYPDHFKSQGIQGQLTLRVTASSDGSVTSVEVVSKSPYSQLDEYTANWVLQNGRSTHGEWRTFLLPFSFRLR